MELRHADWIAFKDEHEQTVTRYCTVTYETTNTVTFILSKDSPAIVVPWHRVLKLKRGVGGEA